MGTCLTRGGGRPPHSGRFVHLLEFAMLLPVSRHATPLPYGRDARLSYRRLRRPTRLPDMVPRTGWAAWLHGLVQRVVSR